VLDAQGGELGQAGFEESKKRGLADVVLGQVKEG